MTYENCVKYRDEAQDIETKLFWAERITRKYPDAEEPELGNNAEPIVELNEDEDIEEKPKPKLTEEEGRAIFEKGRKMMLDKDKKRKNKK